MNAPANVMDFSRRPKGFNSPSKRLEFDEVADALRHVGHPVCRHLLPAGRLNGREWVAGDLHGATGKSLSVNFMTGEWKDFASGESGRDLIALWAAVKGVKMGEAKQEAERWLGIAQDTPVRAAIEPVRATSAPAVNDDDESISEWLKGRTADFKWEYYDRDGVLVGVIYRWNHPSGRKIIRPWNPKLRDYKMPEGDRPLYNLHEILSHSGPIVLVEGEKKVDALKAVGIVATTMMGGANAARVTDWSPLAGKNVIRWADNDIPKPGKLPASVQWLKTTGEHMQAVNVASIRDVAIPAGKPAKWDAADATPEERRALVDAAKKSEPMRFGLALQLAEGSISKLRVGHFAAQPVTERKWLVPDTLPLGVVVTFFGPGGVGKSFAVLDLALKVATRGGAGSDESFTSFFGPVAKDAAGAALYITTEDDTDEIRRRLAQIDPTGAGNDAPLYVLAGLNNPNFDPVMIRHQNRTPELTSFAARDLDELLDLVREDAGCPVRLLAMDPAGDFIEGSEDDAMVVKPMMRRWREIATRHGCLVMPVGHTAKGALDSKTAQTQGQRGSSAWSANARGTFAIWPPERLEAVEVLKSLNKPVTDESIHLVAFGKLAKANYPGRKDERHYLRDPKSGLFKDVTAQAAKQEKTRQEEYLSLLVEDIRRANEQRMPFQISSKTTGLWARRADLSEPLSKWNEKKLRALGEKAVELRLLVKVQIGKSGGHTWLDEPGGEYALGLIAEKAAGALYDAKLAQAGI